ncbi:MULTISPECIES: hypothetical protein [unclassified Butyrivibrio]|uniref:hypothetical protein n=1 Tax=unclassified Butyrivibrio TaxID=2639466 RepID=UPI000411F9A4|nr:MULTISPECIES: hypothetical protein [unclassified Butyrivibrio]
MDMRKAFKKREEELTMVLKDCDSKLKKAPSGNLKVNNSKKATCYYLRKSGTDKVGTYIRKQNIDTARNLAQRDYELEVKDSICKEISAIQSYNRKMPKATYEHTYDNLNIARKVLVIPHYVPDEEYVSTWLAEPYDPLEFEDGSVLHYADNDIRVRSKSEVMIANALYKAGIPFKYECPAFIGNKKIYPDFTILKMPSRKIIYWEHLGMLDDDLYLNKNMEKLDNYEANGAFLGDGLIITRETAKRPLNMKQIWTLIEHHFMQ